MVSVGSVLIARVFARPDCFDVDVNFDRPAICFSLVFVRGFLRNDPNI